MVDTRGGFHSIGDLRLSAAPELKHKGQAIKFTFICELEITVKSRKMRLIFLG